MTVPVLVLNGDSDPWFSVTSQFFLYEQVPDARLAIFTAAGHAAHHQYPTVAAQIVLEFLSGEPRDSEK